MEESAERRRRRRRRQENRDRSSRPASAAAAEKEEERGEGMMNMGAGREGYRGTGVRDRCSVRVSHSDDPVSGIREGGVRIDGWRREKRTEESGRGTWTPVSVQSKGRMRKT